MVTLESDGGAPSESFAPERAVCSPRTARGESAGVRVAGWTSAHDIGQMYDTVLNVRLHTMTIWYPVTKLCFNAKFR